MPDKYLYLVLNVAAISIPLAFSFVKRAHFMSTYKRILPALLIPLILFIIWDVQFTRMGVWGFNDQYLLGLSFLDLPIEEWLFFITIPYASLFTYFALKHLKPVQISGSHWIGHFLGTLFLTIGIVNHDKAYTAVTFISLGVFILCLGFLRKTYLPQFLLSYTLVLIPFFIINGILTGSWIEEPVVWYNDLENLGIRMGTIPVEDAFYGMLLLLMNLAIWELASVGSKDKSSSKI